MFKSAQTRLSPPMLFIPLCPQLSKSFLLALWNVQYVVTVYNHPTLQCHTRASYSSLTVSHHPLTNLSQSLLLPFSPQPLGTTTLLSTSVRSHFSHSTNEWDHRVLFFVAWLLSLNIAMSHCKWQDFIVLCLHSIPYLYVLSFLYPFHPLVNTGVFSISLLL